MGPWGVPVMRQQPRAMWSGRALIAALVCLAGGAALAKPLYITVPRSYGTQEVPVVDVAFADKGPVELRVLRPESLDAFLKSQSNLRRAYEAPPTKVNPGRALSRGLNALRAPGTFLRLSLDEELRRSLSGGLPKAPSREGRAMGRLAEGPPKLVGIPAGFSLVRSEWLNLDLGGADKDFNVPGFEVWGGNSGFQERRVLLEPLPPGVYLLQLVQGRIEGQVVLVITDLTVQVKQTDGRALVRVAGLDQRPRPGATVKARLPTGREVTGKTDEKGEALLEVDEPRLLVTAGMEGDTALVDTDFYSTLAVAPDVFIYSDRPIYRPGDTASFRGILRRPDSFVARLFTPARRSVTVKLLSQEGKQVSATLPIGELGTFAGTLQVPGSAGTGVFRVVADLDSQPHQMEARVQDYVKPTFYLELIGESEAVTPGQPLEAKVRARRYAGGVPADTAYEVFLYRSALDTPAWVDDSGRGGDGSAVTYGSASTTEGKLSVPERLYSSVAERAASGGFEEDPWSSAAKFDENGEAELSISVPELAAGEERLPFRYTLSVRARDDQGTFANASNTYFLADSDVMGTLRMNAKVVKANAAALLAVRATTLSGKPFGVADGEVSLVLRRPNGDETELDKQKFRTAADSTWRVAVPTAKVGTLVARVMLKDKKGRPWAGETTMLVVGEGKEPVARVPSLTLEALGGTLEPGATGQVVALFPDNWGPGERNGGPVWVTLSGGTLFSTRLVEVSGQTLIHSFEVEKRFGSAVYASVAYPTASGRWEERTVPFRVVPLERVLKVSAQPQRKEATPLGEQVIDVRVTDHRGRGVVAQVSVGVVDKAVYAVQAEFRPNILDFFYPVGRNNVSSFYSAEFQGYGYGEALARLLSRLPGHAFAAVKPPTRRARDEDRDTAYWNPGVVTDAEGHARVRFRLPSNQTLWTVTAVAADAAGRFGEGTAEFASRGQMNLFASLPQFLRAGDEAQGSVRLSRGQQGGGEEKSFEVRLTTAGALEAAEGKHAVKLAAAGEQVLPLSLKTGAGDRGEVAVSVTGGSEPISDRRSLPIRPAIVEDTLLVSTWGGGELALPLEGSTTIESAELVLQPSIVDAALANVRELLTYPYGCLEQLVSTTIPNVALYQVLKKAGALDKLDPDSQALLAEARSRAVQGTQRILDLGVKGGGFTLWPGYSTPSAPLTLIALDGLAYGIEAGLVDRNEPRVVEAASWLEGQEGLPFELEATRTYVLARLQGPRQAARARALVENAPAGNLYPIALAVLAAERAGVMKEEPLRERVATLVAQSRDGFVQLASYQPPEAFWSYPLRRVGLSAILAHAASFGDLDVAKTRRRLLEALTEGGLSTFDRSTALLHSLWLIERDAKALRTLPPPQVDGTPQKVTLVPRGLGLAASVGTASSVRVGTFDGVATLRARVRTPVAEVKPLSEGMSLERSYYAVSSSGQRRPLGPGDAVAQGEEVFVELKLDARGERRDRSAYYVVEDPVPAGFVPLVEDKAYRGEPYSLPLAHEALKQRSLSPERATFFFEEPAWWSDSPRVVGYVLRAQFPGRFAAPPATVTDMYAASIRGRTAAATLSIRPSSSQ